MSKSQSANAIGAAFAVAIMAALAQLGLAFGLAVLIWRDGSPAEWAIQLSWGAWLAAVSTIAGSLVAGRLVTETGPRATAVLAAGLGGFVVAPLIAVPAMRFEFAPMATAPFAAAAIGVLAGMILAGLALLLRAIAINLLAGIALTWVLAVLSVFAAGDGRLVELGVWLAWEGLAIPLVPALIVGCLGIGMGTAWVMTSPDVVADHRVTAIAGGSGPLLLIASYVAAGQPDVGVASQWDGIWIGIGALIAGLLGTLLVTALRRAPSPATTAAREERERTVAAIAPVAASSLGDREADARTQTLPEMPHGDRTYEVPVVEPEPADPYVDSHYDEADLERNARAEFGAPDVAGSQAESGYRDGTEFDVPEPKRSARSVTGDVRGTAWDRRPASTPPVLDSETASPVSPAGDPHGTAWDEPETRPFEAAAPEVNAPVSPAGKGHSPRWGQPDGISPVSPAAGGQGPRWGQPEAVAPTSPAADAHGTAWDEPDPRLTSRPTSGPPVADTETVAPVSPAAGGHSPRWGQSEAVAPTSPAADPHGTAWDEPETRPFEAATPEVVHPVSTADDAHGAAWEQSEPRPTSAPPVVDTTTGAPVTPAGGTYDPAWDTTETRPAWPSSPESEAVAPTSPAGDAPGTAWDDPELDPRLTSRSRRSETRRPTSAPPVVETDVAHPVSPAADPHGTAWGETEPRSVSHPEVDITPMSPPAETRYGAARPSSGPPATDPYAARPSSGPPVSDSYAARPYSGPPATDPYAASRPASGPPAGDPYGTEFDEAGSVPASAPPADPSESPAPTRPIEQATNRTRKSAKPRPRPRPAVTDDEFADIDAPLPTEAPPPPPEPPAEADRTKAIPAVDRPDPDESWFSELRDENALINEHNEQRLPEEPAPDRKRRWGRKKKDT